MKLSGVIRDFGTEGEEYDVREAVVTKDRISIDWNEGGETGHLEATSDDGVTFRGVYGYPHPDRWRSFHLVRYTAGNRVLLYGTWRNDAGNNTGHWLFALSPDE